MASLGLNDCLHSSRHAFVERFQVCGSDLSPDFSSDFFLLMLHVLPSAVGIGQVAVMAAVVVVVMVAVVVMVVLVVLVVAVAVVVAVVS